MELEQSQPIDNSAQTASADTTAQATPQGTPDAAAPAQDAQTPAWTPDYSFTVKGEKHEIDEFYRGLVKDEDTLKKVKRMQEQILGLPHLEQSRDELKNKYQQAAPRLQEYERVEQKLNKLSHMVQNRDFGSFFESLQIPKEAILQWVKAELDAQELPPHIRQQVEFSRQQALKNYELDQELTRYRMQEQMQSQQQVYSQLDQAVTSIGGDVAAQFNQRMGAPDSFRNAVINKGIAVQEATGQKLPVEEVVNLVKQDLARVMGITEGQAPAAAQAPQASAKPPVIPAVKAGSASPVKTPPKTLADIRALAKQMQE